MSESDIPDDVQAAVAAVNWGEPAAHKRGRNPRWPYVPVLVFADKPNQVGNREQIRGAAFATPKEAREYAESVIDYRRSRLAQGLMDPTNRALREQHGVSS